MNRPYKLQALLLSTALSLPTLAQCPTFGSAQNLGVPDNLDLDEISGMVASRTVPGVLWLHNDSGDSARIFAMRTDGTVLGEFDIPTADAVDWEDLSFGPGPTPGKDYLYIGDIGDNGESRPTIRVYRIEEPSVTLNQAFSTSDIASVETFTLAYPDAPGTVYNAETLMVEPSSGRLYIVTKPASGQATVRVFLADTLSSQSTTTLQQVATLNFGTTNFSRVTGGDISPDGRQVLLRQYGGVRLWKLDGQQELHEVFLESPCLVTVTLEQQSEVIAFTPDGLDFYTTSEWPDDTPQPIYRYDGPEPPEGEGQAEGDADGEEGPEEGSSDGEGKPHELHSADTNASEAIELPELLRVVQLYNGNQYGCDPLSEDGYAPGDGLQDCATHDGDYNPADFRLSLSELLRTVQLFTLGPLMTCGSASEDGFCAAA